MEASVAQIVFLKEKLNRARAESHASLYELEQQWRTAKHELVTLMEQEGATAVQLGEEEYLLLHKQRGERAVQLTAALDALRTLNLEYLTNVLRKIKRSKQQPSLEEVLKKAFADTLRPTVARYSIILKEAIRPRQNDVVLQRALPTHLQNISRTKETLEMRRPAQRRKVAAVERAFRQESRRCAQLMPAVAAAAATAEVAARPAQPIDIQPRSLSPPVAAVPPAARSFRVTPSSASVSTPLPTPRLTRSTRSTTTMRPPPLLSEDAATTAAAAASSPPLEQNSPANSMRVFVQQVQRPPGKYKKMSVAATQRVLEAVAQELGINLKERASTESILTNILSRRAELEVLLTDRWHEKSPKTVRTVIVYQKPPLFRA